MKLYLFLILSLFTYSGFSQAFVTRDIKSFGAKGDGKTNDHEAFQKAAAFFNARGGNGKLVISKGTYKVGKQIFHKKNPVKNLYEGSNLMAFEKIKKLTIVGQSGAKIHYENGLRFGAFDPKDGQPFKHNKGYFTQPEYLAFIGTAIHITNSKDVTIRNLELDGNSDNIILGGTYGDTGYQIPHIGIFIINTVIISITDVNVHHFGLDGIQIANSSGNNKELDRIVIQNSQFEYNARQGLSWVGGNSLTVTNCKFNFTGKGKFSSAPSAGVDIEAESGPIRNGKFIKCEFIDNVGCGMVADSGPSKDCLFTDCLFWGVTNWSLWINKPSFKVINSKIYGSFVHGFDAKKNTEATIFQNCHFEDKPYNGKEPFGNFLIETNEKRRVRFEKCTMIANKKKIIWMESNPKFTPEEKYQLYDCVLIFKGGIYPTERWVSLTRNMRYKNCKFEMFHPQAETFYFNGIGELYNVDLGGNKYYANNKQLKL